MGTLPDECIDTGDTAWLLLSTILVLGMMPALAFFEAGLLRSTSTVSILTQIFSGLVILSFLWFTIGFGLVFGDSVGGVIGDPRGKMILWDVSELHCFPGTSVPELAYAMFQMMFAAISPLLITGAFAERLEWRAFVVFTIAWEILVYYPVAHWIWGNGWLAKMGVLDFAGGIVLHTTAGTSSLVAAVMVGRRPGFFENDGVFKTSNVPLACVGAALLWMGWFGFNAGSALGATGLAANVVTNTQIASSSCALVWLAISWYRHHPNVVDVVNGAIAGLAGITPASGFVTPQASCVIGIVLGLTSYYSVELLKFKLFVDDALDVSSIHGVTGIIGSLAIGFAASRGVNPAAVKDEGFCISGGSGKLFGHQLLAVVVCGLYAAVWTYLILKGIDLVWGGIKGGVDDLSVHGTNAYEHVTSHTQLLVNTADERQEREDRQKLVRTVSRLYIKRNDESD